MPATAPAHVVFPPIMTVSQLEHGYESLEAGLAGHRQFRKHKVLPRPRDDRGSSSPVSVSPASSAKYDLVSDASRSGNSVTQQSSPKTLKHQSRRIGSGPSLPPTPPRHSRKSSGSRPAQSSSPAAFDAVVQTPKNARTRSPATPPNQQSPPTPDVTPPQPADRPKAMRPSLANRGASRTTTGDSRTESFTTAREEPLSSEEDNDKSTARPNFGSDNASQATVRRIYDETDNHTPRPNALSLALASLQFAPMLNGYRTKGEVPRFEGESNSEGGDAGSGWNGKSQMATMTLKKPAATEPSQSGIPQPDVLEDSLVAPTNAAMAVRQMSLDAETDVSSSPKRPSVRTTNPSGPSSSDTSISLDPRRASAISTKSTASTVVEAFLVGTPSHQQRKLRHVRKQSVLRDPYDASPSSTLDSLLQDKPLRERGVNTQSDADRRGSHVSNMTVNSISSGKARREVWKNGGIPVVVVPERRSSNKSKSSSKEPSLRSTSSRRSRRSASVGSVPVDERPGRDTHSASSRPSRQARTFCETDGLDLHTIDYPPSVPRRSSSLSAPVSRNVSRAGSLTAESIKAHNALQDSLAKKSRQAASRETKADFRPTVSIDSDKDGSRRRASSERHDEFLYVKGDTALHTPFSAASVDTNGTAPEVSEAQAIHMYPHQNSSVLMVNHSAKPSVSSEGAEKEGPDGVDMPERPKIVTMNSSGEGPATPPRPRFSLDDVDSPLRNPRAPPQPPDHPPAINFIPATPSGMTPAHEKVNHMGNYFETMAEKPQRRPSLVRRALSRRRHSIGYPPSAPRTASFLTRTLSLSRNSRKNADMLADAGNVETERNSAYPNPDDAPAEEDKLHPYWRPLWSSDDDDVERDFDDFEEPEEEVYRYPPVDNRPSGNKRSLSSRMKRTFAILPSREDEYYPADDGQGPERRTIRRTPSGNLRVMRHRASFDSLRRSYTQSERRNGNWDAGDDREFLPSNRRRRASRERRRFSLSGRFNRIQSIPRRISERRRQKRTEELRQKISGPREVRDGVGDIVRSGNIRHRERTSEGM